MRVAITGGTGFVGRNTARALLATGNHVVIVARGTRKVAPREGLTVVRADVFGIEADERELIATMQGTMICVRKRE